MGERADVPGKHRCPGAINTKFFFICYLGGTITLLHRCDNRVNDKPALSGPCRAPETDNAHVCRAGSLSVSPFREATAILDSLPITSPSII